MDNIYTTEDDNRQNMIDWNARKGYVPGVRTVTLWANGSPWLTVVEEELEGDRCEG